MAIICFLPILQSISEIICSICEVVKSKLNIFISKNNIETQTINVADEAKNAIGFSVGVDGDSDDFGDCRKGGKDER